MIRLSIFYLFYASLAVMGLGWLTSDMGFIYLTGQTTLGDLLAAKAVFFSVGVTYSCEFALRALIGDDMKRKCGYFACGYGLIAGTAMALAVLFCPMPFKPSVTQLIGAIAIGAPFWVMLTAWDLSRRSMMSCSI